MSALPFETSLTADECAIVSSIDHEMTSEVSVERQSEISEIPIDKRCYMLAKSDDPKFRNYRKASDNTVYHKIGSGPLVRVTKKETKAERKERKRLNKLKGKGK